MQLILTNSAASKDSTGELYTKVAFEHAANATATADVITLTGVCPCNKKQ
jgi:hypothetical protein